MNPRHLIVSGRNVSLGDLATVICEKDQPVRIGVWPSEDLSAHITIGDYCLLSPGVRISAMSSITIGKNCLIANGVYITDSDWHDVYDRLAFDQCHAPVVIHENVWIGDRATILKGVEIGKNSVIAAGSVVTKDVEANCIVAGNPAKKVKSLDPSIGFNTRENLFKSTEFNNLEEYLNKFTLNENSIFHWLRTIIAPKKGD